MAMSILRPLRTTCVRRVNQQATRSIYGGAGGRFMMPGFWISPPLVIPQFREDKDAVPVERFTIDCAKHNLGPEPDSELAERMEDMYTKNGVVRLVNTGLTEVNHMKNYANVIVKELMEYEGGANPREGISKNVYEVGAPNDAWLHYHHEMAYNQHSMENLAFSSVKAPIGKGDTYLSENLMVTDWLLETEFGRKLKDLGVCYIRCLTDREAYHGQGWAQNQPVYNHWQLSFGVETPEEAEKAAAKCGLGVEWMTDPLKESSKRYMKTTFVTSAFEFCPAVKRNVLFSSIADHSMWFDTWQGVHDVPPHKRPLQMTFGDGTPFTLEELRQWTGLYDRGGIKVQWNTGDIVALCNYRFAHGRPAFDLLSHEERQIGVMLGKKFQRIGPVEGAW